MRIRMLVLASVGLWTAAAPAGAADTDADALQGTWRLVEGERDGEKLPADGTKGMTVTFKGDKAVVAHDGKAGKGETFTLDPAETPKAIDVTPKTAGIYELDGDRLRIRFTKDGSARPAAFAGATKKGELLLVLERQKP